MFGTQLADRLTAMGHTNDVVALARAADDSSALDVEVLSALRSPAAARSLRARAQPADVVLGHGSRGLVGGTLATLGTKTPLVYRSIGDPTYWGASRPRAARVGFQLRRAAAVTALWPKAAAAICSQFGVPTERVEIVPNGADERRFAPATRAEASAARRLLDLPPTGPLVLAIGALSSEKRVDRAITAIARNPLQHLVIAGDGPERETLESLAATALPGRCTFLGAVTDVRPAYAAADAVVLPSATEGQPGVVIEAGLCALPVVATDVGGVSSVVLHGTTGVLVGADPTPEELASAIERSLVEAGALGPAAQARCEASFTLAAVSDRFADVLDRARSSR